MPPEPPTDGFAERLRSLFDGEDLAEEAQEAILNYFDSGYTGSHFERLADSDPNRFTANDFTAVSTLGVNIPAGVAIWLLSREGERATSALLEAVPTDEDIWQAPELVSPQSELWELWELLDNSCWPQPRAGNGMGPTKISKLLALKRPRLVPITDSVVTTVLPTATYWSSCAAALQDPAVRNPIEEATATQHEHLSLLRRIDIVLWMKYH